MRLCPTSLVRIPRCSKMPARESPNECADRSPHGETDRTSTHCTENRVIRFSLFSFFGRQWRTGLSVPAACGAGGLIALVEIADDACGLEIVEAIRAPFRSRHGMVNVPRTSLSGSSIVFPGEFRLAEVAVAAGATVNPVELLFCKGHTVLKL